VTHVTGLDASSTEVNKLKKLNIRGHCEEGKEREAMEVQEEEEETGEV
jgi:hypothetical protein